MPEGAGLRLTTAKYYTPSGDSIQATGIKPDILVKFLPPDETGDQKQDNHARLREKDLPNHIENDNGEAEKNEAETENGAPDIVERLERDNQLRTALYILKGLQLTSTTETDTTHPDPTDQIQ